MPELDEFVDIVSVILPGIYKKIYVMKSKGLLSHKLTPALFDVMEALHHKKFCKMSDLSNEFEISMPAATVLVDRLVRLRYITRMRDDKDRRIVRLELTEKGRDIITIGVMERKSAMRKVFEVLTIDERKSYLNILTKLSKQFAAVSFIFVLSVSSIFAAETLELSQESAVTLALENSPEIQEARYNAQIAGTDIEKTRSLFDYYISADAGRSADKTDSILTGSGEYSESDSYSMALVKKNRSGTTFTLGMGHGDNDTSLYGKYKCADAYVSLRQEFGRNFFGMADRGSVDIAVFMAENAAYISLDAVENDIRNVINAYWYYVLCDEVYSVTHAMYIAAEKLHEVYQEKLDTGSAEKVDYLSVKANLKQREIEVASALLARQKSKNALLVLLNVDDLETDVAARDRKMKVEFKEKVFDECMKLAVSDRRDYKRIINLAQANNVTMKISRNSLWPQIDFNATYSANGIDTKRSDAFSDIYDKADDAYFVGISFSLSLDRRREKADLLASQIEAKKIIAATRTLELNIIKDVSNAVASCNSLARQLQLSSWIVNIQQEKYDEELRRVEYGRSNAEQLVRFQSDLLAAQIAELRNRYSLQSSVVELSAVQNTLLEEYTGVSREDR